MPSLYHGSTQIRDHSQFGVYYGSQPIEKIYHGTDLVYLFQPYDSDEILTQFARNICRDNVTI